MTSNIYQRLVIVLLLTIVTLLVIIATQTAHAQTFPWSVQTQQVLGVHGAVSFNKIDAPKGDTMHVMAVGFAGAMNAVCRTTDGGETWDAPLQRYFLEPQMRDLSHPTPNVAVIVGDTMFRDTGSTIFYTRDGGDTWQQGWCDSCKLPNGSRYHLWHVSMCDSLNGLLTAYLSLIARTTDGGATWKRIPDPTNGQGQFFGLQCLSPSTYILNTGSVYRTSDSGKTWTHDLLARGTSFTDFINPLEGWSVGHRDGDSAVYNMVTRTTDGGASWDTVYNAPGIARKDYGVIYVSMADASHGIAVGSGGNWLHTTNGTTWQQGPNLDSIFQVFNLSSVTYPHPNKAWATGVFGHILVYQPRTAAAPIESASSTATAMLDAFPNPITNGVLSISITLPLSDRAKLSLVDSRGSTVAIIEKPIISAGMHRFAWPLPSEVPNGIYFLRLVTGSTVATVPVTIIQ